MNRLLRLICCLSMITLAYPAMAEDCSGFAKAMIDKVVVVFHDKVSNDEKKREQLSALFEQSVDSEWIGKTVLGRYWKTATPEQQSNYLKLYKNFLTNTYVSKFDGEDGYSVDAINIISVNPAEGNDVMAKTAIVRKGEEDVHVDFRLDASNARCAVHDITVEGVSLLVSQRSEFSSLAANGGIVSVLAALQKNVAPKN